MDAGKTLKAWRARNSSMSQQALAVALGVSLPAVSQWERGLHKPRREMALRIDEALDAAGEIFAAFGYVSTPGDRLDELLAQVAELVETVEFLGLQVQAQGDDLGALQRHVQFPPSTGEAAGDHQ